MKLFLASIIFSSQLFAVSFLNDENVIESKESKLYSKSNPSKTPHFRKSKAVNYKDRVSSKQSGTEKGTDENFQDQLNKRTDEFSEKVTKTLDAYYSGPIIIEGTHKIRTLDQFDGIIKDSVLVTQTPEEVIVYAKDPNGPLYDSKLRCMGAVFVQRVKLACDLLITPTKEYPVRVLIREKIDGVSTLLPNKFFTGEEARMIKIGGAAFLASLIDSGKTRATTINGEQDITNMKNKILGGAFDVAQLPVESLKKESNEIPVTAVIDSGREVRIEFLEGVKGEI
jgi:hypothetical protein